MLHNTNNNFDPQLMDRSLLCYSLEPVDYIATKQTVVD